MYVGTDVNYRGKVLQVATAINGTVSASFDNTITPQEVVSLTITPKSNNSLMQIKCMIASTQAYVMAYYIYKNGSNLISPTDDNASDFENIDVTSFPTYSYNEDETKFYVGWNTGEYLHPTLSELTPLEVIAFDIEDVVSEDYQDIDVSDVEGLSEEDLDDIKKFRYIVDKTLFIDVLQDYASEWCLSTPPKEME